MPHTRSRNKPIRRAPTYRPRFFRPVRVRSYTAQPYRRSRRRRSLYRLPRLRIGCGHLAILLVIAGILITWETNQIHTEALFNPTGPYAIDGSPTVSAGFINRVLQEYHSPAAGKGQALHDLGVKYNIDPVFALAFFMHESSFGKEGVATVTHSLGNIRVTPGYADYEGYRRYRTWEAGFEDWYKLMRNLYLNQWHLATVNQIIPRYAPEADNNDEAAYISSIEHAVDTWRGGTIDI